MRILLLIVFLLSSAPSLADVNKIRITNGEWEPFLSNYSHEYGLASHIVSEAFRVEGIEVEWGFYPWKRSYVLAEKGTDWDASAVWWPSDDAREKFLLSDPVVGTSFVFFHHKDKKFDWDSMDDLKGLKVGTTRGYDYGPDFTAALKNEIFKAREVTRDELNLKMIVKGRIDIFPNDPVVGMSQVRNSLSPADAENITFHSKKFGETTLHLLISKQNKNHTMLLETFNSGLKKLKENGQLDKLFAELKSGKYDKKKEKYED